MQQINLYLEEFKEKPIPFSAEVLVLSIAGTTVLSLVISLVIFILYISPGSKIQHAEEELADLQNSLEKAQSEFKPMEIDTRLQSRVENMKKRQIQNEKLLRYLTRQGIDRTHQSFASMLTALTRVKESGLWLTEVKFEKAGNGLSLSGYAQKPESVPNYIKKLGKKKAFVGMQFKVFDLKREEDHLAFTLSSQRQEIEINEEALMEVLGEAIQPAQVQ